SRGTTAMTVSSPASAQRASARRHSPGVPAIALAAEQCLPERARPRRVEARVGQDRLAVEEAEVAGHEWPEGVAGGGAVAANDEGHIRDHAERPGARAPGSARRLTHAPHVRGRGEDGAVDAVGDLAGQAQSLRPVDAEEDRHVARWRGLEGDAV